MLINTACIPWLSPEACSCQNCRGVVASLGATSTGEPFLPALQKGPSSPQEGLCTFFHFCPHRAEEGDGRAASAPQPRDLCFCAAGGNKETPFCREAEIFPSISPSVHSLVCLCFVERGIENAIAYQTQELQVNMQTLTHNVPQAVKSLNHL